MDYGHYQLEDFLTDASFLNYCLRNSEEDVLFWENFIAENPTRQQIVEQAQQLFGLLREDMANRNRFLGELDEFKTLFAAHIQQADIPIQKTRVRRMPLFRYAAAIAGLLILAGVWFFSGRSGKETIQITAEVPADSIPAKRMITLPDGTTVVVNGNSTLEMTAGYNTQNRIVQLYGEALFDVAKNEKLPFQVKCGNVITTALGTSFKVRYYQHESGIKVSLITGKVKVERTTARSKKNMDIAYLNPGQELVIDRNEKISVQKKTFKVENALLWQKDLLTFKDAKFGEIVTKLEEWYGVKILVQHMPKVSKHFTGEFKNKSLSNVLEALVFVHKFEYSLQGDTIRIKFPEN